MTDCAFHSRLTAYFDGELDGDSSRQVSDHVASCVACQDELGGMKEISDLFLKGSQAEMLPLELSRLHRHLDKSALGRPAEADFLRTARMLSALAASVLIISAVWLAEFPSRHTVTLSPGVAVVPASDLTGMAANMPDWERTALTLRVEPSPFEQKRGTDEEVRINQIGLADAGSLGNNSVDSQVADWMVAGLSAGGGHANP